MIFLLRQFYGRKTTAIWSGSWDVQWYHADVPRFPYQKKLDHFGFSRFLLGKPTTFVSVKKGFQCFSVGQLSTLMDCYHHEDAHGTTMELKTKTQVVLRCSQMHEHASFHRRMRKLLKIDRLKLTHEASRAGSALLQQNLAHVLFTSVYFLKLQVSAICR